MDIQLLKDEITAEEGFVPHAYPDSKDLLTIGIGRMVDKSQGGGISREEAEYLLENDISQSMAELDRNYPWWRTLPERPARALVNMCFQLGLPRLSGFKKMLAALEAYDWPEAAREALDSKWAKVDTPERAQRMAAMIREG